MFKINNLNKKSLYNFSAVFVALLLVLSAYVLNYSNSALATSCNIHNGDQATCEATSGCAWDADINCSIHNNDQAVCVAHVGCSYPGNEGNCSVYNGDQSSCASMTGCTYPGNLGSCSTYNGDMVTCAGVTGCSYPGNAGSCSAFNSDSSACNGTSGCSFSGGVESCTVFNGNSAGCNAAVGCSYPGNAGSCTAFNGDSNTCSNTGGCSYPGNAGDCGTFNNDAATCGATSGCSYPGNMGSCGAFNNDSTTCNGTSGCSYPGNAGDCSVLGAGTCGSTSGCTENYGDCSAYSDGGGDGSSCSAYNAGCSYDSGSGSCGGTPFTSCSGGYDNGICTGSYDNGVCTGNYDNGVCTGNYDDQTCSGNYSNGVCSGNYDNGVCTGNFDTGACTGNFDTGVCNGSYSPGTCSGTIIDLTSPSLTSATVDGVTLTLTYDEALNESQVPPTNTFIVLGVAPSSISVSGSSVILTLEQNVGGGTTVTVNYNGSATQDLAGNAAATLNSEAVTNNTETTPPTISEIGAVSNPTSDTTPSYTFTTDEAGTINYGGSCTSATTSASSGSNTISFATLSEATYSDCTISVTDAASNTSTPLSVTTFTVDVTAPVTSGAPNMTDETDSGSSNSDNITNDSTPTFTGVCTDGNVVELFDDGVISGGNMVCVESTFSLTIGALNNGYNTITFKELDPAGNVSNASAGLSVFIDTTSPSLFEISITNPTNDTTPSYIFTSSEAGTITYGGSCTSLTSSASAGSNTISFSTLTEGTYSDCTVRVTDSADNISSPLSVVAFMVDTTAPITSGALDMIDASDSGSSNSDDITNDATPTFTGVCTDWNTVRLYDDGVSSGSSATCVSSAFSLTVGTLAGGSNSITFKETDPAGNTSTASSALDITIDTTSPTISEITPVPDGTDTTPDYTFTTDESGTISYGGSCTSATTIASSGSNTITLDTLAVGTYADCTLIVTDASNNASDTLTLTSFTISLPAADSILVTANSNLSGSGSVGSNQNTNTTNNNNDTPQLPACSAGESFNRNTGLPCTNNTPVIPGCSTGFSFSILTGQSCNTPTPTNTPTPNNPTPTNTPTTYKFLKDIPFGTIRSEDARQLQIFLNTHGFPVATTGVGSIGYETRYFGPATRAALVKFQKANGITPSVGYFGPKTRGYINGL